MISTDKHSKQASSAADTSVSQPVDPEQDLRQTAEKIFQEKAAKTPVSQVGVLSGETGQVIQELQVHQIELELQNQQLRQSQEELDTARRRYFDLYDMAPVG